MSLLGSRATKLSMLWLALYQLSLHGRAHEYKQTQESLSRLIWHCCGLALAQSATERVLRPLHASRVLRETIRRHT